MRAEERRAKALADIAARTVSDEALRSIVFWRVAAKTKACRTKAYVEWTLHSDGARFLDVPLPFYLCMTDLWDECSHAINARLHQLLTERGIT